MTILEGGVVPPSHPPTQASVTLGAPHAPGRLDIRPYRPHWLCLDPMRINFALDLAGSCRGPPKLRLNCGRWGKRYASGCIGWWLDSHGIPTVDAICPSQAIICSRLPTSMDAVIYWASPDEQDPW